MHEMYLMKENFYSWGWGFQIWNQKNYLEDDQEFSASAYLEGQQAKFSKEGIHNDDERAVFFFDR